MATVSAAAAPPSGPVTSKIMHPPEDLSLEEIRARKPKYLKQITIARANAITYAASNSQHQHQQRQEQQQRQQQQQQQQQLQQQQQQHQQNMAAFAHEVS